MNKRKLVKGLKKVICTSLSALFMFSTVAQTGVMSVYALERERDLSGFSLGLNWNRNDDASNLEWNSSTNEDKLVRLNVSYANDSVDDGYEAGELRITVPGIGAANRNGTIEAADVAADKKDSEKKERDWSYEYDKGSDTYTFTNNNKIEAKSNFSGSFEILWKFNSRETKNVFEKTLDASLSDGNVSIRSNKVNFKFTSEKDKYGIAQENSRLVSSDGLGENYQDFIWVNWKVTESVQSKARGTSNKYVKAYIPEGAVLKYVKTAGGSKISFNQVKDYYKISNNSQAFVMTVGYPKDKYDGKEVFNNLELVGKYYDESNESVLASTEKSIVVNWEDYGFVGGPGSITIGKNNATASIPYESCIDGTGSATFTLEPEFHYENSGIYDIAVYDDILDVTTIDDGFRRIADDEYHFESVTVPSANDILDGNSNPITADKYAYELQVRYRDTSDFVKYSEGIVGRTANTVSFSADDVTGIKVVFKGLDTSFITDDIDVTINFHLNDEDEKINTAGYIRNLDAVDLIQDGEIKNHASRDGYVGSWKDKVADRDLEIYGRYMQRALADVPFKYTDTNKYVRNHATLDDFVAGNKIFNSKASLNTSFDSAGSSGTIGKFSQYTILPKGLEVDEDNFSFHLDVSGLKNSQGNSLGESYVKDRINAEIIKNYRGSGRTYIRFDYDLFDSKVLVGNGNIKVTFNVSLSDIDYLEYGEAYSLTGVSMLHESDSFIYNGYNSVDNGSYIGVDEDLWSDLDNDGSKDEKLLYETDNSMIIQALSSYQEIQKSVMSDYTDGKFSTEGTKTLLNDEYSYKLLLRTGNSIAKNVVFYDTLDGASGSEWSGTLKDVDTSYLQSKGYNPTVYYSSKDNPGKIGEDDSWSTEKGNDIKSIAVALDKNIGANGLAYVVVNMISADSQSLIGKKAVNEFNTSFVAEDIVSGIEVQKDNLESNSVTVELSDPIGDITLVKKDSTSGTKLEGAVYTLYYSDGRVYKDDLKTNALGKIVVRGVPFGDYYFLEKSAPKGYEISKEKINVNVDNMSVTVEANDERLKGSVQLYKSSANNYELPVNGATYNLYRISDDGDKLIKSGLKTDKTGKTEVISNLEWGNYYFLEDGSALGYENNPEKVYFNIDSSNVSELIKVDTTDEETGSILKIIKKETLEDGTQTDTPISGAHFNIYDSKDRLVKEDLVTDEKGEITVEDLPYGDYYLLETENKGYEFDKNKKISFSFNPGDTYNEEIRLEEDESLSQGESWYYDGDLFRSGLLEDSMESIFFSNPITIDRYNAKMSFEYACSGASDGLGAMAIAKVEGDNFNIVAEKEITPNENYIDIDDLVFDKFTQTVGKGQYMVLLAYEGGSEYIGLDAMFVKNVKVEAGSQFDENGKVIVTAELFNQRKTGSATLVKMSDDSRLLKDAEFALYTSDDKLVKEGLVTNEEGQFNIDGLAWGSYYFVETKAPAGYEKSNKHYEFTISRENVESNVVIQASNSVKLGSVELIKVDSADKNLKLQGAVFDLYDSKSGALFKEGLVTDAEGSIKVSGLPWGSYYFVETQAPEGYALKPDKIRFSVNQANAGAEQKITVENTISSDSSIKVTKRIKAEDFWADHGNATFVFEIISGDESSSKYSTFTSITFDEEYVKAYTDNDGYVSKSVDVAGLPNDKSWIVKELDSVRYDLDSVAYSLDGTKEWQGKSILNDTAIQLFNDSDSESSYCGEAIFTNVKTNWKDYSHTDSTINVVKKGVVVTGLTVESSIEKQTTEDIDRNNLKVTAHYDDGSSRVLANDEYSLDPDKLDTSMNGDVTITASYEEKGVTVSDSFVIYVSIPYPFEARGRTKQGSSVFYSPEIGWDLDNNSSEHITISDIEYCEIFSYTGNSKTVVFPSELDGVRVKSLSNSRYSNNNTSMKGLDHVESIIISEGIEEITNYTFRGLKNLKGELILPESLTFIGRLAFYQCSNLIGDLIIPDNVSYIGDWAFSRCGFDGLLRLSKNLDNLPEMVFYDCSLKGDLIIPEGITSIGSMAFKGNEFSGKLIIPDTVKTINDEAFSSCTSGTFESDLNIPDSVTYIGAEAFYLSSFSGKLKLSENLSSIENYTFANTSLSGNLIIPENVKTIGENAFYGCDFDGPLTLGNSLVSIGKSAFLRCEFDGALTLGNNLESIGAYAFGSSEDNPMFIGDLIIPDSVKTIGDSAFEYCGFDGALTLGDSLESIGDNAFESNKTSPMFTGNLIIPDSVKNIGEYAFSYCGFNGTLTLSNNLESIKDWTFASNYNDPMFTGHLNIPDSVKTIGPNAFLRCGFDGLLTLGNNLESIGYRTFESDDPMFTGNLIIPDSVKTIDDYAFRFCGFNGTLTLGISLESIGDGAFEGNISAPMFTGNLIIPDNVKTIGRDAFNLCGFDNVTILGIETLFSNGSFEKNAVIHGWGGSNVEKQCLEYGYTFVDLRNEFDSYSITVEGTYDNVVIPSKAAEYEPVSLTTTEDGKEVTSFMLDDVFIEGNHFIMPSHDVVISNIIVSDKTT